MKRFLIECPECGFKTKISFSNIQVTFYGLTIHIQCVKCKIQHMLGGDLIYRKLDTKCHTVFKKEITNITTCRIYGLESAEEFEYFCNEENLKEVCLDIWNNPEKWAERRLGDVYYDFLKYIWILYPDRKDIRLAEFIR